MKDCPAGTDAECDDSDLCTTDVCDTETVVGRCDYSPTVATCLVGGITSGHCSIGGVCTAGACTVDANCVSVPCNVMWCNTTAPTECVAIPVSCDDGVEWYGYYFADFV
jgi:hypothetical protein